MPFSNLEAFDMLMVLGECRQNYRAAERMYAERYPQRAHQSFNVFRRLAARICTTGQVQPTHNRGNRIARHVRNDKEPDILAAVIVDPHISTRGLARDSGISQYSVCRILKDHKFHPYHMHMHQELSENDFQGRVIFCNWLLNKGPHFPRRVLWTDEASFKSTGEVNIHNAHYWSQTNPHWLQTIDNQHLWSVNTWCGILGGSIIGPYFFEGTLNGIRYAEFLGNDLIDLLENVPLLMRARMWFQQDGCPAHFSLVARNTINQLFPNRWIGRGSTVVWPPRSPDCTPLDFFLWGRIKDIVYTEKPTTRDDMKLRIRNACLLLSNEEILRATDSVTRRAQQCLEVNGRHFEHL